MHTAIILRILQFKFVTYIRHTIAIHRSACGKEALLMEEMVEVYNIGSPESESEYRGSCSDTFPSPPGLPPGIITLNYYSFLC